MFFFLHVHNFFYMHMNRCLKSNRCQNIIYFKSVVLYSTLFFYVLWLIEMLNAHAILIYMHLFIMQFSI